MRSLSRLPGRPADGTKRGGREKQTSQIGTGVWIAALRSQ
jgi:hypothetical protein